MMPASESIPLVCFAVSQEAAGFLKNRDRITPIRTLVTGMGAKNATSAVQAAIRASRPAVIISTGFAGGLNPEFPRNQVLHGVEVPPPWQTRLASAGSRPAQFVHVTRIVATAREKARLRAETGADAVEMESSAIAEVARTHGIPFVVVRVVSDAWNEDLPMDFHEILDEDLRISPLRLTGSLLRRPTLALGLLRLSRSSGESSAVLGEALARALAGERKDAKTDSSIGG